MATLSTMQCSLSHPPCTEPTYKRPLQLHVCVITPLLPLYCIPCPIPYSLAPIQPYERVSSSCWSVGSYSHRSEWVVYIYTRSLLGLGLKQYKWVIDLYYVQVKCPYKCHRYVRMKVIAGLVVAPASVVAALKRNCDDSFAHSQSAAVWYSGSHTGAPCTSPHSPHTLQGSLVC